MNPVMKKIVILVTLVGLLFLLGCTSNNPNTDQNANLPVFTQNKLNVTVIEDSNCLNCFKVEGVIRTLNVPGKYAVDQNRRVSKDSNEGKSLIELYQLKTLPSVIVTGEVKDDLKKVWTDTNVGTIDGNTLIMRQHQLPYFGVEENRIVGEVEMIIVQDSNCLQCKKLLKDVERDENGFGSLNQPVAIASDTGGQEQSVFVSTVWFVERSSKEGQALIERWGLQRVPTILFSSSLNDYDYFNRFSGEAGFVIMRDGWFVNQNNAPFFDLNANQLRGLVNLNFLVDRNCSNCFVAGNAFQQFFEAYGVGVGATIFYDINDENGKELVKQFKIEAVPTVIANKELQYYPGLFSEWPSNWGSITPDGNFVFRAVKTLAEMALDKNVGYQVIDWNQA